MSVNMSVLLVIGLLFMMRVVVSQTCESYTVSSTGSLIYSRNFPDNYPDYEDQCWTFSSSSGSSLMVEFYDFETESLDDVTVYDGLTTFDTVLATLNGYYSVYDGYAVYSTGQNMRIRFESDSSVSYQGFQACVCEYSYYGCSCDLIGRSDDGYSNGLPAGAIAGIVIGVLLFISIPIIIIVACCCCCGKTKGTTQSNNTYAARRARGELVMSNRAGNPDRKHNQVRPTPGGANRPPNQSFGPQPPPYMGYPQHTGVILTPTTLPHGGPGPAAQPYAYQHPTYPPPPVDPAYPPPPPASYVAPMGPGPNGAPPGVTPLVPQPANTGPYGPGPAGNGPPGNGPHGQGPPGQRPAENGPPGQGPAGNGPPGQ